MPSANFFAHLGMFVVREFLDAQSCARFRSEMRSSSHTPLAVIDGCTYLEKVKESVRRTKYAEVSPALMLDVEARLLAIKPRLESHFNLTLAGCEKPQFLVYNEGDFFRPHRDRDDEPGKPEYIKKRQVSVVIFLNDTEGSGSTSYCGGELTFFGLIDDPPWKMCGLPLATEAGLMIAFRSEIIHEVSPITSSERFTIVSWFF